MGIRLDRKDERGRKRRGEWKERNWIGGGEKREWWQWRRNMRKQRHKRDPEKQKDKEMIRQRDIET